LVRQGPGLQAVLLCLRVPEVPAIPDFPSVPDYRPDPVLLAAHLLRPRRRPLNYPEVLWRRYPLEYHWLQRGH